MSKPYPMEFRRDVVQVATNRPPGVSLEKIAADFGIHPITLSTWLKKADIDDGVKPGVNRPGFSSYVFPWVAVASAKSS